MPAQDGRKLTFTSMVLGASLLLTESYYKVECIVTTLYKGIIMAPRSLVTLLSQSCLHRIAGRSLPTVDLVNKVSRPGFKDLVPSIGWWWCFDFLKFLLWHLGNLEEVQCPALPPLASKFPDMKNYKPIKKLIWPPFLLCHPSEQIKALFAIEEEYRSFPYSCYPNVIVWIWNVPCDSGIEAMVTLLGIGGN